jgi:hypothetical protein
VPWASTPNWSEPPSTEPSATDPTVAGAAIAVPRLLAFVASLSAVLVAISGHYANMVNATFTEIGSGVWTNAGGKLWVTHVFRG